jgi:hypothetical protein
MLRVVEANGKPVKRFADMDCFLRVFELAVFGGRKLSAEC